MDQSYQRALVLLDQRRYDLAEKELREAITAAPNDGYLHALLADCLIERGDDRAATDEAQQAVHLEPELPQGHATLSRVLLRRNHFPEALAAIGEALRLDPGNPNFCAQLAAIHLERREWEAGLAAAERGLEADPEHVGCNNLRAMALVKLGRREEAGQTMASTLARDPDDAFSHANQGWACLHAGDRKQALDHFREALRLDPTLEFARYGIVEAMKAKNFIYALFLRYFLWMGRLSSHVQWAIVLGGYFGYQWLAGVARRNPDLVPWLVPLLVAYAVFALMTWIAAPLFNLLLRLDRYGRYALSRDQIVAANWIGGLLAPALVALIVWLVGGEDMALFAALYFGLLLLPVSALFQCQAGWPRNMMTWYALALAGTGAAAFFLDFLRDPLASPLLSIFLWGSVLSGFVANFLMAQAPRR
jgi:tetratricopeptide (TPR) repeat protein